jgi:hypothetical protein
MKVRESIKAIREKFEPFTITAHWNVESNHWHVDAQKHEGGDTHELATALTLPQALEAAAVRKVGKSWQADKGT